MDLSRISKSEIIGIVAGAILVLALIFLDWFSLAENPAREIATDNPEPTGDEPFICGFGQFECTGFETFPILRWLLIAGAVAPLILTYIVIRQHKLTWAPGEVTMIVGFIAFVLILFNGVIDPPGSGIAETGISKEVGYWVALAAAAGIAASGIGRMFEESDFKRKTPGTV